MLNRVDYVSIFAREHKLDILAVSETWLLESSSSFVAVDNYFIVKGDVLGLTRTHGVCLYVKRSVRFVEVHVNCPNVAAVHLMDFEVWVLCIYSPPSYSAWENEVLIGVILDFCERHEVVILGDFNLPSLL